MTKKAIQFKGEGLKDAQSVSASGSVSTNIGLTEADCICATMKPHCPVHSVGFPPKQKPLPGHDVIR
jgi:hypothetical protein